MTSEAVPIESPPAQRGGGSEPGSVARYLVAVAALGLAAIVWAVAWETIYVKFHIDVAWLNFFVGIAVGLAMRKLWGIGGFVCAVNALILMAFSLGLGHLVLFEHYALSQQAADDIGIAPSFRTVMAHLKIEHWLYCASALFGVLAMPLRRN